MSEWDAVRPARFGRSTKTEFRVSVLSGNRKDEYLVLYPPGEFCDANSVGVGDRADVFFRQGSGQPQVRVAFVDGGHYRAIAQGRSGLAVRVNIKDLPPYISGKHFRSVVCPHRVDGTAIIVDLPAHMLVRNAA